MHVLVNLVRLDVSFETERGELAHRFANAPLHRMKPVAAVRDVRRREAPCAAPSPRFSGGAKRRAVQPVVGRFDHADVSETDQ